MSNSHKQMKQEFEADYKVEPHYEAYNQVMGMFDIACENAKSSKNGINPDKPKHYDIGIDTFTRMRANATFEEAMGFIRWNIDKYNTRAKGQDEEDYKKIEEYCKEAMWWFVNRRAKE